MYNELQCQLAVWKSERVQPCLKIKEDLYFDHGFEAFDDTYEIILLVVIVLDQGSFHYKDYYQQFTTSFADFCLLKVAFVIV